MTDNTHLKAQRLATLLDSNVGAKVALLPLAPEHIPDVVDWEHHPSIACQLFPGPEPPETITSRAQAPLLGTTHHLAIVRPSEETLLGYLTLGVLSGDTTRTAPESWGSFTIVIGPEHQRQGYGRHALTRVPWLFQAWHGLEVLQIGVFEENTGAIRLYRELGYHEIERRWFWTATAKRRVLMMSNTPAVWRRRPAGFRQH